METKTINELCEEVIQQMSIQRYSENLVAKHIKVYGRLLDYAARHPRRLNGRDCLLRRGYSSCRFPRDSPYARYEAYN